MSEKMPSGTVRRRLCRVDDSWIYSESYHTSKKGNHDHGVVLVAILPEIQKSMWNKYKPMKADLFAEKALSAVAKNEAIVIIPVESRKIIGLSMRRKCRWFCRVMIKTR